MTHYLDTSLLVAAVTPEVATHDVLSWLERHAKDDFTISDWTRLELTSALSIKVRVGHLDAGQRDEVQATLDAWTDDTFDVRPVERADFDEARRLIEASDDGLRSGDALHLAIARQHGRSVVTLDRKMAEIARRFGFDVVVPDGTED